MKVHTNLIAKSLICGGHRQSFKWYDGARLVLTRICESQRQSYFKQNTQRCNVGPILCVRND